MPKLVWDQTGEKRYETGVDRGVLYPKDTSGAYPSGVAWNGLTKVSEELRTPTFMQTMQSICR